MTSHSSGRFRPSNRRSKAMVIGSVAVGVVTVSSGVAMASHRAPSGEDREAEHEISSVIAPTATDTAAVEPAATTSTSTSSEICFKVGSQDTNSLRSALRKAKSGRTATLRVPDSAVVPCPTPTTTDTASAPATSAPAASTSAASTSTTASTPSTSTSTTTQSPVTTTATTPTVTSTAS